MTENKERTSPTFEDPTVAGLDKMFNTSWVKDTLSRFDIEEDNLEVEDTMVHHGTVDSDYELSHVL